MQLSGAAGFSPRRLSWRNAANFDIDAGRNFPMDLTSEHVSTHSVPIGQRHVLLLIHLSADDLVRISQGSERAPFLAAEQDSGYRNVSCPHLMILTPLSLNPCIACSTSPSGRESAREISTLFTLV